VFRGKENAKMPKKIEITKVFVDTKKIIDRRDWVKYLVLVNWHLKELGDQLQKPQDAAFEKYVVEQLDSYFAGKQPPAAIAGAIMNIADEHLTGGEVTLRAGDYIALQGHYRQGRH
jgi:hypothetical protein